MLIEKDLFTANLLAGRQGFEHAAVQEAAVTHYAR